MTQRKSAIPTDLDLITMFVQGRGDGKQSTNLLVRKTKKKQLQLVFQKHVLATLNTVESTMGTKKLLVADPQYGTTKIWRAIFGDSPHNIFWIRELIPLTLDKALSINAGSGSNFAGIEDKGVAI